MAYEITVGPAQLTINVGECVFMTEPDGTVHQPSDRGLFYRDTRLISAWTIAVNGQPWDLLSSAVTAHYASQIILTNPTLPTDGAEVPKASLSLTISRMLGLGGMRETLSIRNHNRTPVRLSLSLSIASDFGDIFDVKSHHLVTRGDTVTAWNADTRSSETIHTNQTFRRGLSIASIVGYPPIIPRDGMLTFVAEIPAQSAWSTELTYHVVDGDKMLDAPACTFAQRHKSPQDEAGTKWRAQAMRLHTPVTSLQLLYDQSLDDLAALRLPIDGTDLTAFVPAAGIPWFAALFGRDSLITAIQTVPIYPAFACGALEVLARYQATSTDDSRDMQPGKIPHELRRGELAELGLVPYRPYYGTADATPLYIVLLHQAYRFTGDRAVVDRHLATAERCLEWIDHHGDMDGDGFQEYQRRSPSGAENQSWKDSGNAILYENGDDVPAPKALCELQGYVYDAWRRMAAIYSALDRPEQAAALHTKALDLRTRFNDTFWDDDLQYYALCLDPQKKRVMSIASNAGHLLWSGIVPPDRARAVVKRLMADDMYSGWGIRTLSADHPAYNPHDYQLGAIWPHDNGLIVLGLKKYGFHAEAARVACGLIDAGSRFLLHRLPEVFAGTARVEIPFPVQYLGANVPQAWAAGTVFCLVRALLGAETDGAANALYLDPWLPGWLPELRIENLSVGQHIIDFRVWRDNDQVHAEITRGGEYIRLVRQSIAPELALAESDRLL